MTTSFTAITDILSPTLIGIGLACLSALSWAGLDAMRKALGQQLSAVTAAAAIATGALLPFGIMVGLDPPSGPLPPEFWLYLAGSSVVNIAASVLSIRAVQLSPLALTVPYLGFSPVFVLTGGMIFLNEVPTLTSSLGVCLVVAGALWLNPRVDGRRFNPIGALLRERGSVLMLIVALLWSTASLFDRRALQHTGIPLYALLANLSIALPLLAFTAAKRPIELRTLLKAWPLLIGTVVILCLAMVTQFKSWEFIFVAYSDSIKRAGGMLFGAIFGYIFFGERDLRKRLPAIVAMGIGVAVILLGSAT